MCQNHFPHWHWTARRQAHHSPSSLHQNFLVDMSPHQTQPTDTRRYASTDNMSVNWNYSCLLHEGNLHITRASAEVFLSIAFRSRQCVIWTRYAPASVLEICKRDVFRVVWFPSPAFILMLVYRQLCTASQWFTVIFLSVSPVYIAGLFPSWRFGFP